MATPPHNGPPTIANIAESQQHLTGAVEALSEAVQALVTGQSQLNSFVAEQRDFNGRVESFMAQVGTFMSDANGQFADANRQFGNINTNLTATNEKLDGLKDDIGLVKGGHARNELRHRASLIADDLGYQLISELPQGALIAFAKIAVANGVAPNEVESFRNADMVMMVQDSNNQPGYVAVEVSYTVNSNDVRRAVRNADYL
jgi:hypothetical protein